MKIFIRHVIFIVCFFSVQIVSAVQAGDPAPAWQARDMDGELIDFPVKDRTTVMVYWATWCPYCRVFMPYLSGIEADYADKGVRVLAINTREEEDGDPVSYIKKNAYKFQTVLNGDNIAKSYSVHYIPGLLIIGRDGQVIYRRKSTDLPAGREVAEFWDSEVRTVLDEYLN